MPAVEQASSRESPSSVKLNYRWVKCEVTCQPPNNHSLPHTVPRILPPCRLAPRTLPPPPEIRRCIPRTAHTRSMWNTMPDYRLLWKVHCENYVYQIGLAISTKKIPGSSICTLTIPKNRGHSRLPKVTVSEKNLSLTTTHSARNQELDFLLPRPFAAESSRCGTELTLLGTFAPWYFLSE